ncbi:uncharacterized protein KIAA1522 homolog [Lampris incognitus]|uniref:uncharacterized protein KIAA1522 homolog n=1 Tax=Lampris incognitus TaxID=2546036 RepID=UPI0024B53D9E|nr:uncharacterized protein KIAA1522 homolog [Lampris incognitus]
MSSRDSIGFGDLIPQDVVEVIAQERHTKGGRKKRSSSLGRAFGWLKGKKRKDINANGQNLGLGPGPDLALDGRHAGHPSGQKTAQKGGKQAGKQAHPQGNSHAVPKQEDEDKTLVPPLFQENVFIEASRPKYLEDLHTEAMEGLKMMQQKETNNGVDYRDDESSISTVTIQAEDDGKGFLSDSTIPDTSSTVSAQSSLSTASTRSSRSGLTRQGSTFRPLNSGKKSEKAKTRRRHRKTVMGIPHHIQRELGLDRIDLTVSPVGDEEQLPNGELMDNPSTDEPDQVADVLEGARVNLQTIEALETLSEGHVQQFNSSQAGHRDDLALLHRFTSEQSAMQRPRSLAVPWMTTGNSLQRQPPSPVMSMSPQATYMSKIIPNAVMPPSIDVVAISSGRNRSSLRTVSKSSLLLASPASSRASSRASSSRSSTHSSVSRQKSPNISDSSGWSRSESSETLVSDSSTISSSSTPRQSRSQEGDGEGSSKDGSSHADKVSIHSSVSKASRATSNGQARSKGTEVKKEGPFIRSLSVMKSKRAPPPPSRSYSLHNKMKRRSRDLAEVRVVSGESSPHITAINGGEAAENKSVKIKEAGSFPLPSRNTDSPGYTADTSSLDDSTGSVSVSPLKSLQIPEKEDSVKGEEAAKDILPMNQDQTQENGTKKTTSPSSGYSSQSGTPTQPSKKSHSSSPRHKRGILAKLQSLFPGPSHPSVASAPSLLAQTESPKNTKVIEPPKLQPIPSEDHVTASPSVKALRELFSIPPPPKVHAPPPPPPEVWAHNKHTFELLLGPPAPDNTYTIVRKNPKDRRQHRQSPSLSREGSQKSLSGERKQKTQTLPVDSSSGARYVLENTKVEESERLTPEVCKGNKESVISVEQPMQEKVEKVGVSEIENVMQVKVIEKHEERLTAMQQEHAQSSVTEVNRKIDTLSISKLVHVSPSPSPPPAHHPPLLTTTQTIPVDTPDISSVPALQPPVSPTIDSSWPPPPPLLEQANETLLSRSNDMDFPLPPPPPLSEEGLVIPVPPTEISQEQSISHVAAPQESNSYQLDAALIATSVAPVGNAECSGVATELAPLESIGEEPTICSVSEVVTNMTDILPPAPQFAASLFQGIPPPPKNIPPPPSYTAPPPPPTEISPPPSQEIDPPSSEKLAPLMTKEVTTSPHSNLTPPQNIPPPQESNLPPLQSDTITSVQVKPTPESVPPPPKITPPVAKGILSPPQTSPPPPPPPPPPTELQPPPQVVPLPTDDSQPVFQDLPLPPPPIIPPVAPENAPAHPVNIPLPPPLPSQAPVKIPLPPPLPSQAPVNITGQPSLLTTENKSKEQISFPAQQEDSSLMVTPTLLQTVKLRSVNRSPDPVNALDQAQPEVIMRAQQPNSQAPTPSASGEAPQKPIRRSLIMISPIPTTTPETVSSQPEVVKSQSNLVLPMSPSTITSPAKKSPPAMATSPSMNLQEAIRLRTATRTKDGPPSCYSLHSQVSPLGGDLHKSPSSTASFIFSKSTKKVATETKTLSEAQTNFQTNLVAELSSVSKPDNGIEPPKKGVKVPPPVAKKPKPKAKEMESNVETKQLQTAGQEAQPKSIEGTTEEANGTAGSVEEQMSP